MKRFDPDHLRMVQKYESLVLLALRLALKIFIVITISNQPFAVVSENR
jgi:hypothetical protein